MVSVLASGYTPKVYLSGSQTSIHTQSLASGNDLRVVYWDGKAWKELDRDLVSFSSSAIELRSKTQADIAASGQDANYYLYYGNPTAGSPPSEGKKIYSYFNEFSINVLDWTAVSGTWGQAVTTGADGRLTWTYRQSDANNGSGNTYQKTLSLTDFVYEVKAKIATAPSGGHAAAPMWRYGDTTHYYAFDYGSGGYTGLWKYNGAWAWLQQTTGISYVANTWYTIVMTSSGSSQSAKVGSDTWSASDSGLSSGTIGLHTYLADVYYDDVKVRKLVSTEPTIVVGAEASRPVGDKYYYAGSQRIGMRSGGTLSYIFSDHLGGTSVTLNASSGVTSTVTYFPFGSTRAGSVPTDYGFTGQRNDSSSGLMDYGARRYDPSLGRFISPDAIVSSLNNPQDFNRYSYAENNPTRFIDPSGHRGVDIGRLWRMLDFGGGGGGSGGGGKLPKVPAGTSAQPIKVKPMTVDSVREAGKGSESTAGGAPGRGSTRSTADPIAEPLGQGSGRGGPAEKAPVETGSGGKAKSIEAMRKANEEHADFYERWRSEKPEFRETNRTIKDPVTRKTILDEDGNYDGRRFDGVDYRTGEVAEFKTGQRTRQSSDAAWKQAEEYANTLNDVYGYEDFFWARVYWSDEE